MDKIFSIIVTSSKNYDNYAEVMRRLSLAIQQGADAGYKEIVVMNLAKHTKTFDHVIEFINKTSNSLAARGIKVRLHSARLIDSEDLYLHFGAS